MIVSIICATLLLMLVSVMMYLSYRDIKTESLNIGSANKMPELINRNGNEAKASEKGRIAPKLNPADRIHQ